MALTLLLQGVECFDDGFQVLAVLSIGCFASDCRPAQAEGLAGAGDRTERSPRIASSVRFRAGKSVLCGGDFQAALLDLLAQVLGIVE
jgi:hypothetical protein